MKTRSRSESQKEEEQHPREQSPCQMQSRQAHGNLGNALDNYDGENRGSSARLEHTAMETNQTQTATQEHPSLLTIQIPTGARIHSEQPTPDNRDTDRNRSSTFGSEFDVSWTKDRGMSISCLLTPMGEDDANLQMGKMNEEGTNATVSTSSTTSALPMPQSVGLHHMPSLREKKDESASVESASMFLSDSAGQPKQQQRVFSHTPPTNVATSYEQRHFQKRLRAGVSL